MKDAQRFLLLEYLVAIVGYSSVQFQYYGIWGNTEASLEAREGEWPAHTFMGFTHERI